MHNALGKSDFLELVFWSLQHVSRYYSLWLYSPQAFHSKLSHWFGQCKIIANEVTLPTYLFPCYSTPSMCLKYWKSKNHKHFCMALGKLSKKDTIIMVFSSQSLYSIYKNREPQIWPCQDQWLFECNVFCKAPNRPLFVKQFPTFSIKLMFM